MKDYATSGLDIQSAMVDLSRQYPKKSERPPYLLWNGKKIVTSDAIVVPATGVLSAKFISEISNRQQGFDLKLANGSLALEQGEQVSLLRTWMDERFENEVTYPFCSKDGVIWFWNVYKREWPDGSITDEKWTGNAGFWIEEPTVGRRIYHCSHGMAVKPEFESMVVEIVIKKQ